MASDREYYDYLLQKYNTFAGNPTKQNQVIMEYYDYFNPEAQSQRKQQSQLMEMLFNRGQVAGTSAESTDVYGNPMPANSQFALRPPTTTTQTVPQEEVGTFGFGNAPGQLFGKGGLAETMTQPIRQGIISPLASIGQVIGGTLEKTAQGQDLATAFANTPIEQQKGLLTSEQEQKDYMSNPMLGGIKSGAGLAAYAIPGGATTIPGMAARGAIGGALGGFGSSRPGQELERTILGAGVGAVAAPVINLTGKAIGKGISKVNDWVKNRGANAPGEMGQGFLNKSTYEGGSPAEVAQKFGEDVSGEVPEGGIANKLQQTGLEWQGRQMGMTAQRGSKNFVKDFSSSVKSAKQLTEFFDEPFNAKGISSATERAAQLVDNVAETATKPIDTKWMFDPDRIRILAADLGISTGEAETVLWSKLNGLSGGDISAGTQGLAGMMENSIKVPAQLALAMKRGAYDGMQKVAQKGSSKASDLIDDYVYTWAKRGLDTVPGVSTINKTIAKAIGQQEGLIRAFNTGQGGFYVASPQSIPTKISTTAMGLVGKGLEKVGSLGSGTESSILNRLNSVIAKSPELAAQVGGTGTMGTVNPAMNLLSGNQGIRDALASAGIKLTELDMSQLAKELLSEAGDKIPNIMRPQIEQMASKATQGVISNGLSSTISKVTDIPGLSATVGLGTLGPKEGIQVAPQAYQGSTGLGLMGEINNSTIATGGTMQDKLKEALQLSYALTGELNLDTALSLMDKLGGSADTQKIDSAEQTLTQLQDMWNQVGYSGEGLASRVGGGVRGLLGSVGWESNVQTYRQLRESVKSQLARALGETGNLSDSDKADVIQAVPDIGDTPQEAEQKWNFIFSALQSAKGENSIF